LEVFPELIDNDSLPPSDSSEDRQNRS
jgi:hypothetical protein